MTALAILIAALCGYRIGLHRERRDHARDLANERAEHSRRRCRVVMETIYAANHSRDARMARAVVTIEALRAKLWRQS